jgi:hypothetical protein
VVDRPLDPDRATWPELRNAKDDRACFVAGVEGENPALLRAVLRGWPEMRDEPAGGYGLPVHNEALEEIAAAVEDLARARSRLARLTRPWR